MCLAHICDPVRTWGFMFHKLIRTTALKEILLLIRHSSCKKKASETSLQCPSYFVSCCVFTSGGASHREAEMMGD